MATARFPILFSRETAIALLLFLLAAVVYSPVLDYGFINYDDPLYVTQNAYVKMGVTLEGLLWAFRDFGSSNWHPLTWLSHMIDWQWFGDNAGGHHATNILLHAGNAILLFILFRVLTGAIWQSAIVAAMFAVHPLNVESVAWIAERKNLLSTFLGLVTLIFYTFYIRNPGWKRYLPIFVIFALGLMTKPMLVTLPFLLLVLDYWPGKRIITVSPYGHSTQASGETDARTHPQFSPSALLLEKIPLILLSFISIGVTLLAAERGGSLKSLDHFPLLVRFGNSLSAYASYLGKFIWPRDLAVFYPHPGTFDVLQTFASLLLILFITAMVLMQAKKGPYLTVGWLWFLGTLVPVIGLIQVGLQAMADRYLYFPMIGLLIMLIWGAADLGKKNAAMRISMVLLGIALILGSFFETRQQLKHWRSSRLLFEHTLAVTGPNAVVYSNLAHALFEERDWKEAEENYLNAIRCDPKYANAHANLGAVLDRQGRSGEALEEYRKGIALNPGHADAHYHLGLMIEGQGNFPDADRHYGEAQNSDPAHIRAVRQRGTLAMKLGNYAKAAEYFRMALQNDPGNPGLKDALSQAVKRRDALDNKK